MDARGFRALAQRCRDLSQIAARLELREQLREWVDDLEAEAEAADPRKWTCSLSRAVRRGALHLSE